MKVLGNDLRVGPFDTASAVAVKEWSGDRDVFSLNVFEQISEGENRLQRFIHVFDF